MVRHRLNWDDEGCDWPNRHASRFVIAGGLRWHVQILGAGPPLLLVHGTGAATHSWRALAPLLGTRYTVVAPDLPGHGFTSLAAGDQLSLPGMAAGLRALLATLEVSPRWGVGHSAGAAVLARMALDAGAIPGGLVSLNGAMLPLQGLAGQLFSPAARLLASSSLVPRLFARRAADPAVVQRMLKATGSCLDERGVELYGRLVRSPGHAEAALGMMAQWDLSPLARELSHFPAPLLLVAGGNDRTVPPREVLRVCALVAGADVVRLPGLGHLAHEEQPQLVAEVITSWARWG